MNGVEIHIAQHYPKGTYSEMYYLGSQVSGGINYVQKTFDNEGARAVYMHRIYWVPTNSGAVITFSDQNGLTIFSTVDNFTLPNNVAIHMVRQSQILKVLCDNVAIKFFIAFQYIIHYDGKPNS